MKLAIETLGTRGDVQPYIALAHGLKARGHEVQLAAPEQFTDMIREAGLSHIPLPGEFLELMNTPEGKAAIAGGEGFAAGFKLLKHVRPLMGRLLDQEWVAVRDFAPDAIVYHPKSLGAPDIANALAIPHFLASPLPGFTPTAAFPTPMLPYRSLGPLNRLSHSLAINGGAVLFKKDLAAWRARNGLPAIAKSGPSGTLYAYSPAVLPVPPDWDDNVQVTGYWFLDDDEWTPDDGLAQFIAAGDKPVYVGFGSMPGLDPVRLAATIAEALARTGMRGVLASGWGALEDGPLPAHVHVIRSAPHNRLLPLMAAALHHGGAGTTAASLRADLPTAIMPFFGDQPFWARRVHEMGVGPAPLDRKTLTADTLAAALVAMKDPGMRARAAATGAAIRSEHGVETAIRFIEERTTRRT